MKCSSLVGAVIVWLMCGVAARCDEAKCVIADDGGPKVSLVGGSVRESVDELKSYLDRITGADFTIAAERQDSPAIYVGVAADFPWHKVDAPQKLGGEGFVIQVADGNLFVIGNKPLGVQQGVTTLLHELGCRWFFPGEVWEVVPRQKNLSVAMNVRRAPSFPTQRRIWYGFGAYGPCKEDWDAWVRHNRMGGPLAVGIGHSWAGLNAEKDFPKHPEWFALVDGKRQPSKPCYSNPDVLAKAKEAALRQAERGDAMISMTPPDGLGYCSCEKCKAVAGVTEVFEEKGSLFGKQADGTLVNVTSETVFRFANDVAEAVAAKYPDTLIGCYAYSAYSHPPSFKLHPNVYLQTTTAYRRTPLSLEEQVSAFGEKTEQLGIREYYSVYQWDWDYPDPGKMTPDVLKQDLSNFHAWGVTAVNAEASNNWAARGLGYFVASQLLWDIDADTRPMVKDFYEKAFGPAAPAMERYFVRWYGPSAAALGDAKDLPQRAKYMEKGKHDIEVLRAAYADLDDAITLARMRKQGIGRR